MKNKKNQSIINSLKQNNYKILLKNHQLNHNKNYHQNNINLLNNYKININVQ
jgi:hypothetical protein